MPFEDFPRERCDDGGLTVNLKGDGCKDFPPMREWDAFSDYLMRKMEQRRRYDNEDDGGFGGPSQPGTLSAVNASSDQPLQVLRYVAKTGMYRITEGMQCISLDAGATTETLTVSYIDPIAGPSTVVLTLALTAVGTAGPTQADIFCLAGSSITAQTVLTGAYGAAKYNAFAVSERLA